MPIHAETELRPAATVQQHHFQRATRFFAEKQTISDFGGIDFLTGGREFAREVGKSGKKRLSPRKFYGPCRCQLSTSVRIQNISQIGSRVHEKTGITFVRGTDLPGKFTLFETGHFLTFPSRFCLPPEQIHFFGFFREGSCPGPPDCAGPHHSPPLPPPSAPGSFRCGLHPVLPASSHIFAWAKRPIASRICFHVSCSIYSRWPNLVKSG